MKIRSLLLGCLAAAGLMAAAVPSIAFDPGMTAGNNMIIVSTSAAPAGDGWLLANNDLDLFDPGGAGAPILWLDNVITDVAMLSNADIHDDSGPIDPWENGGSMIGVADTSQLCGVGVSAGSGETPLPSGVALGHVMAPGVLGFNGSSAAIAGPDSCSTFGSAGSGLS